MMADTRDYTLTVREVLQNLKSLATACEQVASGTSPTGNYYFSCNAADAAANIYAAMQLILLVPQWIPVSERLPEDRDCCLVALEDSLGLAWWHNEPTPKFIHEDIDNSWTPTHWMPLPEPPEVRK